MQSLILAGGSGTRLWPVSRSGYPKQFLKLGGEDSLLQRTIKRNLQAVSENSLSILTNQQYHHDVVRQVREIDSRLEEQILLEPMKKNTAPAIALAAQFLLESGVSEKEVLFVCPADHVIAPEDKFIEYLKKGEALAQQGHIVTLGVTPHKPETGYGYIRKGETVLDFGAYQVDCFVEKPDGKSAQSYLLSGEYLWNAGIFLFTIETFLNALQKYAPDIFGLLKEDYQKTVEQFSQMPDVSIDYAIMEKADNVAVLPLDLTWSDVGSWDNLYDVLEKDGNLNVKIGEVLDVETTNSLIVGGKRLISTIGLNDMLVIETEDVLLVSKRSESQKVKQLVEMLKIKGRREVDEHVTSHRPWGSYTVLECSARYKIKKIIVNPKQKLSLQMHYHRSEHWVVVQGTAKVTIAENETILHENESIYVPKCSVHRVENPGKVPLEIIEVQVGEYLGEDDIVRFEDIYGRGAALATV